MEETTIRFAQKSDLNRIVELCELHAQYEKAAYSSIGKIEALEKHLFSETTPVFCLVSILDNEIVGYATFMKQFSTWDADFYIYMDCLFLTVESRGSGIGQKLVEVIKREALKLGCDEIQWQTPDFNKRAMKFYDRIGGISKSKERYFLKI